MPIATNQIIINKITNELISVAKGNGGRLVNGTLTRLSQKHDISVEVVRKTFLKIPSKKLTPSDKELLEFRRQKEKQELVDYQKQQARKPRPVMVTEEEKPKDEVNRFNEKKGTPAGLQGANGPIVNELTDIYNANNLEIPRGTFTRLAEKYGVYPANVQRAFIMYVELNGRSKKDNYQIGAKDVIVPEDLSQLAVKRTLSKLEGAIEGLAPFHPGLARYMQKQLNYLYRYFHAEEIASEIKKDKGEIAAENFIMGNSKYRIIDNKMMRKIDEDDNFEEGGEKL